MPATRPYCELADLVLGNIPTPTDAEKYIIAAAEEIDSRIGLRYATPVVVADTIEERPTELLLKKINTFLATGRLILALAAGGEDVQLHQYGLYLVNQSLTAIEAIVSGSVVLPGATPATEGSSIQTGPQIFNVDDASSVEAFQEVFGNPASAAILRPRAITPWGNPPWANPYTW